ncbi:hypothetical protein AX17_000676 [Amanita inopinata Kibby_2008]|nr:hypothetical protein AX17_000676 [Amanita inopinata Kibby_2008]
MQTNAFSSLAILQLPTSTRLLQSSCCPDKDLLILVSRLGGQDRVSLWNSTQGTKTWEVDIGDENNGATVVDVAWSPDGQSVAILHDPPLITLHSVQDGKRLLVLATPSPPSSVRRLPHLLGIWWFREDKRLKSSAIPDIFKRNDVITGSTLSILKDLPLLDSLQEDEEKITATDLFAFQGSQTRPPSKSQLPDVIQSWPALSLNVFHASVGSSVHGKNEALDEAEESNANSILVVSDDLGNLHHFLDGTFPVGPISLGSNLSVGSLFKLPTRPIFLAHPFFTVNESVCTDLNPSVIELPLLSNRKPRDLAVLSSTARALTWYVIRAVKEMRAIWFGSETNSGAREIGPKWIRALEERQKEQYGQDEPNPMLDLTCLLLTGRASESLLDYLGSGEQMSERGIQKWQTTMAETLVKLRDFSEKRVAPACQRLHLVLEELHGWSQLPQYNPFGLSIEDLITCLDLTGRAVVIASWLAAVARRELSRFREFVSWLRFETSVIANTNNDPNPTPKHDLLEVNNYFMSGLVVSSIDKWFMGPIPSFSPRDLGLPGDSYANIPSVLEKARSMLNTPGRVAWQVNGTQRDLNHLDRNLDALVQELATRCRRIFNHAAYATSRSSVVSLGHDPVPLQVENIRQEVNVRFPIRERTNVHEGGEILQHLASMVPSEQQAALILIRLRFNNEAAEIPCEVGFLAVECHLPEEDGQAEIDLLEAEFFDDELVVIIYRLRRRDKLTFMATVKYNDLGYQPLEPSMYVKAPGREDLMLRAMGRWREGNLRSVRIPIRRCRALKGCKTGRVFLAVNGRVGRRVACALDGKGTTVETFDLEGDAEDMEITEDEDA